MEGGSVDFIAQVSDPDGVADVIGGTLRSVNGVTYGNFSPWVPEGRFQLTLSWDTIHQVEPIVSSTGNDEVRSFVAKFIDFANYSGTRTTSLTLTCNGQVAADGQCLQNCQWPSEPYGVNAGVSLSPSLCWEGYAAWSASQTTVSVADYFDCDGSRGINALLITGVKYGCGLCNEYTHALAERASSWQATGIAVILLLLNGLNGNAPTVADALTYREGYGLDWATSVADPSFSMSPSGTESIPQITVIDPRNMKVILREEGYPNVAFTAIESLAAQNAGP